MEHRQLPLLRSNNETNDICLDNGTCSLCGNFTTRCGCDVFKSTDFYYRDGTMQITNSVDQYLSNEKMAKQIAKGKVLATYKSNREWKSLFILWDRESRWDYTADNPRSSAYGIPQMLNMPKNTPMVKQIDLGLKYIKHRYGTPSKALAFHNRNGWY